jgi:hypothetical protein
MKTILGMCAVILLAGGFLLWKSTQLPTLSGTFTGAPEVEVSALIDTPKNYLDKTVLIRGQVLQQCKAMGCFFFFSAGEKQLRVDLEKIAMNAPMREGHVARVEGQMMPFGDGYQLVASAVEFQ